MIPRVSSAASLPPLLLWGNAVATVLLAGMIWVVQLVVYPGFRAVGAAPSWLRVHAAHSRRMALAVSAPWLVQGLATVGLLVHDPSPLVLLTAALAAATVAVTAAVSVPLHRRLDHAYDDATVRRLIATNWWRTAAWTAGAACSLVLLARGPA